MCPKTSGVARTPPDRTMSETVLEKIISEVVPHVFRIDLVGDGEILLVPSLILKVLNAAAKQKILVNASTNGVILTEELANMLVRNQLHDLNISLDAAQADTYRAIRGADLDLVLRNIKTLNQVKKKADSLYPRLQFSMVGMKRNIDQLPALVHLAAQYGAQSVMVQAMGEFDPVENESISLRDREHGRQILNKTREIAHREGVTITLWPQGQFDENTTSPVNPIPSPDDHVQKDLLRIKDCDFPWDVPYFATDGSVRPCCAMAPLGNLDQSSFSEIWFGDAYTQLRRQMKSLNPPAECRKCPGRGWYQPVECRSELLPGRDDHQFGTGWFETETYKGENYRWARENAVFFITGKGPGVMEIDIHTVWDIGTTQVIDIQIDEERKHTVTFTFGERRVVYLPVTNSENLHSVRISGKGWRPVTTVPGELDPRSLTVMFYGARMRSMGDPVRFSDNIVLRGYSFSATSMDRTHSITLFWENGSAKTDNLKQFFHVFPDVHHFRSIVFRGFEILRRFDGTKRFQLDIDFPSPSHSDELMIQQIQLQAPPSWSSGQYPVFMGLIDPRGNRIHPQSRIHSLHRSAIQLGLLEIK
ncbi:SPASM domain-containing protein [bacterium]|nr:SPASM domain-containing protein [candidate division CSSED10-310 bacterium]